MPTATIEAKYINQPQQGRKLGSVKDAAGTYYGVKPEMLGMFQQGGVYEIFYESRDFKGKTYHSIKTAKPTTATSAAAGKVVANAERAMMNKSDAEQAWVCHLLGCAIQGGKLDLSVLSEVVQAGQTLLEAKKLIFADKKPAQTQEHPGSANDMDDEIPF